MKTNRPVKAKKKKDKPPKLEFATTVTRRADGSFIVQPGCLVEPPLTVQKVSARLGITETQVLNFIEEGQLEAFNIGTGASKHWRVRAQAVESFIASRSSLGGGNR
jgi:excisionase family DNA binding protein